MIPCVKAKAEFEDVCRKSCCLCEVCVREGEDCVPRQALSRLGTLYLFQMRECPGAGVEDLPLAPSSLS